MRHRRVVKVFEMLQDDAVRVEIRHDLAGRLRAVFEASVTRDRYLTDDHVERLESLLSERFQIGSFRRRNYWDLWDETMLRDYRSENVRRLRKEDLPALERASCAHGLSRNPADFLGFSGGYGYFARDGIVSWANVVDIDETRSDTGNVHTLRSERNQGYGTAVTWACARAILSAGRRVSSSTERGNVAMNAVFRKLGFEKIAEDFVAIEEQP